MATINKQNGKYRVRIRIKGFPCASATFPTKDMAQRWAAKTEAEIVEQKYFGDAYKHTLGDMINLYVEREAPLRLRESTIQTSQAALEFWQREHGGALLAHFKARHVLDARDNLLRQYKPATVNRYVACLSSVLTYAEEREYVLTNVCRRVRTLPLNNQRDRVLKPVEEDRLFPALMGLDYSTFRVAKIALRTGARRKEILRLQSVDVDLNRMTITFRDTKSGKDRTIPFSNQLIWIKDCMPLKYNNYAWLKALKQANIEDFHFHDLRHTFITRAIAAGHNPMTVATMVGHSYPTMTQRYTHLCVEDLRQLV